MILFSDFGCCCFSLSSDVGGVMMSVTAPADEVSRMVDPFSLR